MQGRGRKLKRALTPGVAPYEPGISGAAPALPDEAGCSAVLWFCESFTDLSCFPVLFKLSRVNSYPMQLKEPGTGGMEWLSLFLLHKNKA